MTRYRFAYVDHSATTYVIACHACPHWSAMRLNKLEALEAKGDHDARVHDKTNAMESARIARRKLGVS